MLHPIRKIIKIFPVINKNLCIITIVFCNDSLYNGKGFRLVSFKENGLKFYEKTDQNG